MVRPQAILNRWRAVAPESQVEHIIRLTTYFVAVTLKVRPAVGMMTTTRRTVSQPSSRPLSADGDLRRDEVGVLACCPVRQVSGLLAFELVMFPILCGWILDAATLDVFGSTMSGRLAVLAHMPLASMSLHWYGCTFLAWCRPALEGEAAHSCPTGPRGSGWHARHGMAGWRA